ncbi:hypothetical protein [Couchioplanes azureus]|uniref:hypothetical protein n=1 Tax=Couchioplanes caeruleus TaxID=56438 RepID=UPI00166F6A20|nr:hypothetical protein [Couchioplanes caeruleus]
MPAVGGVVLSVGLRLHLSDNDYRYGTGDIEILVRVVEAVNGDDDDQWVALQADEVFWDRSLGFRYVSVRVSALRDAIRRPSKPDAC